MSSVIWFLVEFQAKNWLGKHVHVDWILDMIPKWGRFEIENGTIQAEHLLEIMGDIGGPIT